MNEKNRIRVLGPVDQLPAEGYNPRADFIDCELLDFYVSALSRSEIGFVVSERGIDPARPAALGGDFQVFDLTRDGDGGPPRFEPGDEAFHLDFTAVISGHRGWDDLNDASEPEDYVRRFLEVLGTALDDPELTCEGRRVPLIRWAPLERGDGARVQLLGILMADDEKFDDFCRSNVGDVRLFFEDPEIEAHGIREVALSLAVLGISLAGAPRAEAGLFERLFSKDREAHAERVSARRTVRSIQAPVQRGASAGWVDVHHNASIDHHLLAAADSGGKREVIVDIQDQRAYLIIDGRVAVDTPVSTAREGKLTPRGEYKITQRVRSGKTSSIYGCDLPYWMRLDESAIGMHIGDLPGYPASAGCVRLPYDVAPVIFDHTTTGTVVKVVDSWDPSQLRESSAPVMLAQVEAESSNS